jgi:hypothetical protein
MAPPANTPLLSLDASFRTQLKQRSGRVCQPGPVVGSTKRCRVVPGR